MSARKKQQLTTTMNPDELTTLPDPIRRHILSFLPLKDIIRLQTLSTRWKSVCSTLSHFHFDQPTFSKTLTIDFKDFVYQVLLQHKSPEIHKFQLTLHLDRFSLIDVTTWITFAVRHNVQHLILTVLSGKLDTLSTCFFTTNNNLSTLALTNIKLKLPPTFKKFHHLKSLTLVSVEFWDDKEAGKLFSSCPLLEELTIVSCYFKNLDVFKFPAPNLRFLKLLGLSRFQEIGISFPGLRRIVYSGRPPSLSLETLLSLYHVEFHLALPPKGDNRDLIQHGMSRVLEGLHNVGRLSLEGVCIEFLTADTNLLARLPTSYNSLNHLKLELYPDKNQVEVVMFLIRRFPNLQSLCISIKTLTLTNMVKKGGQGRSQESSTQCILQRLRKVEIKHFGGSSSELDLVKFLLANGTIVEEIRISYSQHKRAKDIRKDINEKLESFVRVSPKVAISFS